MASALKNLSEYDENNIPKGTGMRIGIVVAAWNAHITNALYEGCYDTLIRHGVPSENIHTMQVPGSFELPVGARILYAKHQPDAVICLGCVIKGETTHNEYINHAVATGLTQLSLSTAKPFVFGLLTTNDEQQAIDRAGGQHGNKGVEAAVTALRMAALKIDAVSDKNKIGF
jgi:6,7-dimethyl-8-ribityllumazine synthase